MGFLPSANSFLNQHSVRSLGKSESFVYQPVDLSQVIFGFGIENPEQANCPPSPLVTLISAGSFTHLGATILNSSHLKPGTIIANSKR